MRLITFAAGFAISVMAPLAAASPPCPAFLSIPQENVTAIAVDEKDVYFSQEGRILRVQKEGGTPRPIVKFSDAWVMVLALDATNVYFGARDKTRGTDAVYSVAKAGGAATRMLDLYAQELIPDGEWLYVLSPMARKIVRVRKDASTAEMVASGNRPMMGMVLDGDWIYFTELDPDPRAGGVRRVAKSGGRVTRFANVKGAVALAHDKSNLYVVRMPENDGFIDVISKSDGRARNLVSGITFEIIEPLALYGDSLHFGHMLDQRTVRMEVVRPSTGERRTLREFEGGFPRFAADECGVYFSTKEGIQRITP